MLGPFLFIHNLDPPKIASAKGPETFTFGVLPRMEFNSGILPVLRDQGSGKGQAAPYRTQNPTRLPSIPHLPSPILEGLMKWSSLSWEVGVQRGRSRGQASGSGNLFGRQVSSTGGHGKTRDEKGEECGGWRTLRPERS
jgi:hypothetical protein